MTRMADELSVMEQSKAPMSLRFLGLFLVDLERKGDIIPFTRSYSALPRDKMEYNYLTPNKWSKFMKRCSDTEYAFKSGWKLDLSLRHIGESREIRNQQARNKLNGDLDKKIKKWRSDQKDFDEMAPPLSVIGNEVVYLEEFKKDVAKVIKEVEQVAEESAALTAIVEKTTTKVDVASVGLFEAYQFESEEADQGNFMEQQAFLGEEEDE